MAFIQVEYSMPLPIPTAPPFIHSSFHSVKLVIIRTNDGKLFYSLREYLNGWWRFTFDLVADPHVKMEALNQALLNYLAINFLKLY